LVLVEAIDEVVAATHAISDGCWFVFDPVTFG